VTFSNNLKEWNALEETDPKYTKTFGGAGSFQGTAVSAIYNVKRVTEQLGPVGVGWGWKVLNEYYKEAPADSAGGPPDIVHVLHVRFWRRLEDGTFGHWETFGCTPFAYATRNGRRIVDADAPKKSLTDALSKGMSVLGASADIWMNDFNDNRYVAGSQEAKPAVKKQPEEVDEITQGAINYIRERLPLIPSMGEEDLAVLRSSLSVRYGKPPRSLLAILRADEPELCKQLTEAARARAAELDAAGKEGG
jgi:hypothetical protein